MWCVGQAPEMNETGLNSFFQPVSWKLKQVFVWGAFVSRVGLIQQRRQRRERGAVPPQHFVHTRPVSTLILPCCGFSLRLKHQNEKLLNKFRYLN